MKESRKGLADYFIWASLVRFVGKLVIDLIILLISLLIAFLLRFEATIPARFLPLLPFYLSVELLLLLLWEVILGIHKTLWRFTAFQDFLRISLVISLEKLSFSALSFLFLAPSYPRSVILTSWAFALIGMVGIRALRRYIHEAQYKERIGKGRNLLIIGAGSAGRRLAQEISLNPQLGYKIVGFLDDDPAKRGSYLLGYPILGSVNEAGKVVEQYDIEEIIVAIPSYPQIVRGILRSLLDLPVKLTALPSIRELALGKPLYQSLKDIDLADLLPRPFVEVNMTEEIGKFFQGKVVLVTGAGGSIGAELCRQLASFPLKKLVLLGHGENPLFFIEQELKELSPPFPFEIVVGDIRDEAKMNSLLQKYRPHIVFHTAAHKHVPLMELNPDEAITNNVYGTKVLATASARAGVEKFIYISTDKAVNPVNVMGAAKRVGELLMKYLSGNSSTAFISVRFGNVLGSKGSVLEVWERCIEENKPIPITHPDMERYFMTIPEAVSLILKAAELGKGGDLFVLDMGEPMKIVELARLFTRLRGLRLGRDIKVVITGIRPGEKLKEELVGEGESIQPTSHPSIMRVISNEEVGEDFPQKLEALFQSALTQDPTQIKSALKRIVKNYNHREDGEG